MRKEVRSVCVGTATHIVDRPGGNARIAELKGDELCQVAVRSLAASIDHRSTSRRLLHLAGDFFSNLEGGDPDVRADRGHELAGVVRHGLDCLGDDARDRASPPCMHGSNVPSPWVGEQNRHAVGSSSRNCVPGDARDERIALRIGNCHGVVVGRDLSNEGAVNLALLEETIERNAEALRESRAVLANGIVVVAQVKAEVQRVVRRFAHPAVTRGERMLKAVPSEQG